MPIAEVPKFCGQCGTPLQPGLILGLLPGGACRGLAHRLPVRTYAEVRRYLVHREIDHDGVYEETVRPIVLEDGRTVPALVYLAVTQGDPVLYVGNPPGVSAARRRQSLDALKGKKGADFDAAYIEAQTRGHQETLDTLKAYSASGEVPSLKEFAAKLVPIVTAHLNMAKGLKS